MNPDLLAELADSTDRAVQALVASWLAGELSDAEFVALATAALERAQAEGVALADAAVAASLGAGAVGVLPTAGAAARVAALVRDALTDRPRITITRTPGTDPAAYIAQLRAELAEPGHDRTFYASRHQTIDVIERFRLNTRDEVLASAQEASGRAVRRHGARWTRRLNRGACALCQDLAGDVLPSHAEMYRHKGCGCTQRPIKKENPQ